MKVGIVSDLHTEFWKPSHEQVSVRVQTALADADVILMAGDIGSGANSITVAGRLFPDKPVFLIAGNHEFYNGEYDAVLDAMREAGAKSNNVQFLHQDDARFEHGGVHLRILGTTLWTDFDLHMQQPLSLLDAQVLNDFRFITVNGRLLTPHDTLEWHHAQRKWLLDHLYDNSNDSKTVVLTHHAPVSFAIAPRYVGDELSPCFASRMEQMLLGDECALVVWGHTHYCIDRTVQRTRFVSNQTGYPITAMGSLRSETGQYGQVVTVD